MNIQELNRLFNDGALKDYTLAEYELCRYIIKQGQPKTISIIGGNTNLDVFYSCQDVGPDIAVKVTNWDRGTLINEGSWKARHKEYQKLTGFTGNYEWVPKSIRHYSEIGNTPDLLWINACQESLPAEIEDWPSTIIFAHYGMMINASSMVGIRRHIPLRAIGRTLAIFSKEDIDLTQGTGYMMRKTKFLGKDCMEIMR